MKPKQPVSPIQIPEGAGGFVKNPNANDMPALPTDPLAKVPPTQKPANKPLTPPAERPTIDPVNKPKLPEIKPDIPDIDYTGSGIEVPLMPIISSVPVMPALRPKIKYQKM